MIVYKNELEYTLQFYLIIISILSALSFLFYCMYYLIITEKREEAIYIA